MNDNTPQSFTAMVETGRRELAAPSGQIYITHDQAVKLYGDPVNGSTYDENSILGAPFDIREEVLKVVLKKGGGDVSSPLNKDYSSLQYLFDSMMNVMTYTKSDGVYFEEPRTGLGQVLGKKLRPLEEATTPLAQSQWHLETKPSVKIKPIAPALEVKNFLGWVQDLFDMTNRYREDLGEEKYQQLMYRFQTALPVPGISENIAGILPETTAQPGGAAALINTTPSQRKRG